ncbi:MAG: EFR1 family ferrodoxin [Candidatus Bathyarchaeia archaeon]
MRGIVVYYSASGNTRKIAKAIHRGMSGVIEADIASVMEVNPQEVAGYDLIGVGSPVWFFRETANVRRFIYNMPRMDGKFCFFFCTHAEAPFWIFRSMASALQRKGLKIIGWGDWYGASNICLHMPIPSPTHGHPDELDVEEAEKFGREMAERFLQIVSGRKELIPEIPRGKDAPLPFRPHPIGEPFPGARPERRIDKDKCMYPSCTLCVDNCPSGSIKYSKETPLIESRSCWNCSLCDRLCPVNAIMIEPEEARIRMKPQKVIDMTKCNYPSCKLCIENCPMDAIDFSTQPPTFKHSCEGDDLCWCICPKDAIKITNMEITHIPMYERMLKDKDKLEHLFFKLLKEAEEKGRFRRLTPIEKIGWYTPLYKIPKIPRFTIPQDP